MSEQCECKVAEFCERWQRKQNRSDLILCKDNGPAGEQARRYWATGTKASLQRPQSRRGTSVVGTQLKAVFRERYPGIMKCSDCRTMAQELNNRSLGYIRMHADEIVADIVTRAPKMAPKLWQRIAVVVDLKLQLGKTQERIRDCLEEAIQRAAKLQTRTGGPFRMTNGAIQFVTARQLQADILTLVGMIPPDTTAIAGVARSGLAAATMVAMYTHLPLLTIRQSIGDVQQAGNGWRLQTRGTKQPDRHRVLVVDDTVMTGNSTKQIRKIIANKFDNVTMSAVYCNPRAKVKPDFWVRELEWPHLLEWNLFNSVLSPNMAVDFDGILCRDCPPGSDDDGVKYLDFIRHALPLYLPRKNTIPLIVTARIERYRSETMAWLAKHNISVKKLVMHPAQTLAERNRDDIAAYKARHFSEWASSHVPKPMPPVAFIESDDRQAQAIAKKSGRMVICPASGKVY